MMRGQPNTSWRNGCMMVGCIAKVVAVVAVHKEVPNKWANGMQSHVARCRIGKKGRKGRRSQGVGPVCLLALCAWFACSSSCAGCAQGAWHKSLWRTFVWLASSKPSTDTM